MEKSKWVFKISPNGNIEVEGFGFSGNECVEDIIFKLLQEQANIEKITSKTSADERPVENVYYLEH